MIALVRLVHWRRLLQGRPTADRGLRRGWGCGCDGAASDGNGDCVGPDLCPAGGRTVLTIRWTGSGFVGRIRRQTARRNCPLGGVSCDAPVSVRGRRRWGHSSGTGGGGADATRTAAICFSTATATWPWTSTWIWILSQPATLRGLGVRELRCRHVRAVPIGYRIESYFREVSAGFPAGPVPCACGWYPR